MAVGFLECLFASGWMRGGGDYANEAKLWMLVEGLDYLGRVLKK